MLGTVRLMEGAAITRDRRQIVLMLGTVWLMEAGAITWDRRQIVLMLGMHGQVDGRRSHDLGQR
jgi:hypothetical protein